MFAKCKIKYKTKNYRCEFKDKLKITIIKIKLCIKRCIRLLKVVFPKSDLLLYMLIICLWLIFAWVSNFVDFQKSQVQESYLSTLWALKNSIFSTVIIAFAVGSFNHLKDYRTMIKRQHYIYVDAMDDFEKIIEVVDDTEIWLEFHPMYNEHCFRESIDYLENKDLQINIDDAEFLLSINAAKERVRLVEEELKMGHLLVKEESMLNLYLSSAKQLLSSVALKNDRNEFTEMLEDLFEIVDALRFVWRKDENDDSRIISILDKDNKDDIRDDFYKRMFLPDFKLELLTDPKYLA